MFVTRLEYPDTGLGPFTSMNGAGVHQPYMNFGRGDMPLHDLDRDGFDFSAYRFGFVNAEQANLWWDTDARISAADNGYMLAVYDVPDDEVKADDSQCIFPKEAARLVAHIDPERWVHGDLNMLLVAAVANYDPNK